MGRNISKKEQVANINNLQFSWQPLRNFNLIICSYLYYFIYLVTKKKYDTDTRTENNSIAKMNSFIYTE